MMLWEVNNLDSEDKVIEEALVPEAMMGVSSEILTDVDVEVEAVEDGEVAAEDMMVCFAEVRILASEDAEDTGEITDLKVDKIVIVKRPQFWDHKY